VRFDGVGNDYLPDSARFLYNSASSDRSIPVFGNFVLLSSLLTVRSVLLTVAIVLQWL